MTLEAAAFRLPKCLQDCGFRSGCSDLCSRPVLTCLKSAIRSLGNMVENGGVLAEPGIHESNGLFERKRGSYLRSWLKLGLMVARLLRDTLLRKSVLRADRRQHVPRSESQAAPTIVRVVRHPIGAFCNFRERLFLAQSSDPLPLLVRPAYGLQNVAQFTAFDNASF
jgi:hypothetical protein